VAGKNAHRNAWLILNMRQIVQRRRRSQSRKTPNHARVFASCAAVDLVLFITRSRTILPLAAGKHPSCRFAAIAFDPRLARSSAGGCCGQTWRVVRNCRAFPCVSSCCCSDERSLPTSVVVLSQLFAAGAAMQWSSSGLKGTPRFCCVSVQVSRRQRVSKLQCDVSVESVV